MPFPKIRPKDENLKRKTKKEERRKKKKEDRGKKQGVEGTMKEKIEGNEGGRTRFADRSSNSHQSRGFCHGSVTTSSSWRFPLAARSS
jgi:hypothetical protein